MFCKCDSLPKGDLLDIVRLRNLFPPFGISNHPLSTRSRFLRATVRSTSSALCLHHALPFVVASDKGRVGAKLPASELRMFCKCDSLPKGDLLDIVRLRNLFPPFGISKHPLSIRSRFLRATVRSTGSALCLHHALPFVVAAEKRTCFMRRSKAFGHAVAVSKTCYKLQRCDCALSCAMRLLQTNEPLSGFSFSAKVGWERSCQPLSCACSVNVIHCRKEICWTLFV